MTQTGRADSTVAIVGDSDTDEAIVDTDALQETRIGVVVPAYNEAAHIGDVLDGIPTYVDRIYVVDDASEDDTWEEIQRRVPTTGGETADGDGLVDRRIVPIQHDENQGPGIALRTGYEHALNDGIDVTVAMDADGQMDPDYMPALVAPIIEGEADYAKGNRLLSPESRQEIPPFRRLGSWLLTVLTKVVSGYWKTMDPLNGYTAISHEALGAIDLSALPAGHYYPSDILVRLNVAEQRVADVAIPARYGNEESTIRYSTFIPKSSTHLARLFVWRLHRRYLTRDFHPLALFYGAGIASLTTGVVFAAEAVNSRRKAKDDASRQFAIGGVLALLLSGLFWLSAMVFDADANDELEVRRE